MSHIQIRRSRGSESPRLLAQAWHLRHEVFRDGLGWDVSSINHLEYDHFDDAAHHCFALEKGEVVAYWRSLCTVSPYLLEESFGILLGSAPAPKQQDVWEISRFLVRPGHPERAALGRLMVRAAAAFGVDVGARELLAVVEPPFARFIRASGLPIDLRCPPTVVGVGRHGPVKAVLIGLDIPAYATLLDLPPAIAA